MKLEFIFLSMIIFGHNSRKQIFSDECSFDVDYQLLFHIWDGFLLKYT